MRKKTQNEIERQIKEYKLVTESLFRDEIDTKNIRLFTMINTGGLLLTLICLFFLLTK